MSNGQYVRDDAAKPATRRFLAFVHIAMVRYLIVCLLQQSDMSSCASPPTVQVINRTAASSYSDSECTQNTPRMLVRVALMSQAL